MDLATLAAVMRYPVKSTSGESVTAVSVGARGLHGDRSWAAYLKDGGIASGKTTRRFRRVDGMLDVRSWLGDEEMPVIELPTGCRHRVDDPCAGRCLSEVLDVDLELRPESTTVHHDEAPVHVVTTAGIRALEDMVGEPISAQRFRPNLVLELPGREVPDLLWCGRELALGDDVILRLDEEMPRCRMIGLTQHGLPERRELLTRIAAAHGVNFGLKATVVRPGRIQVGDRAAIR